MVMSHFCHQHDLVHHMATHTTQCLPESVKIDDLGFLNVVCPKCAKCTHWSDFIINMDQASVYFKQMPRTTINVKGVWTVHMCQGTNDGK